MAEKPTSPNEWTFQNTSIINVNKYIHISLTIKKNQIKKNIKC